MPRSFDETKSNIILESFIRNKGHYRKMSEELTEKYGSGYSVSMISNVMNSVYINEITTETEKENIKKIMTMNVNKVTEDEQIDNLFYSLSLEQQEKIIIELYLGGKTMDKIATVLGISKSRVSRIVKSAIENSELPISSRLKEIKDSNKKNNDGVFKK